MSRPLALVTGGTAGLGLAFAETLAARGHDLVLVARDQTRLHAVAAALSDRFGVDVEVLGADLSDRTQLRTVEERVADPARPVELLVNNAGFGLRQGFLDNDVAAEQAMLDVLVTAVLRLSHAALTAMVERGHGRIVNVSSVAGWLPRGTYCAAKAYVTQLSVWADLTYRDRGVRTMALCPGFVRTDFHGRMDVGRGSVPSWLWLDADAVVTEALDDLDRGRSVSVPDLRYKVLAAVARVVPARVQARFPQLGRG
jgi:short-subunit dehydrogenase